MNKEEILKKISSFGILFLIFLPLFVINNSLYPFVFWKAIFFRIVIAILFLFSTYLLFKNQWYKIVKNKVILFLGSFLFFLPLVSLFSTNAKNNWWGGFERMEGGFYYIYLLVYLLLLLNYLRNDDIWKKVFICSSISFLLIDVFAIAQKYNINLGVYNYPGRIGGTVGNAAYLASVLLFSLILLSYFFYKYKKYRFFVGFVIILNIFTIFISATRASILALVIGFFFALIFSLFKKGFLAKKTKKLMFVLLFLLIIFSSSIFVFKNSSFVQNTESLRRISSIGLEDTTSNSRLVAWSYSWQAFQDKPVFGWGLENYDAAFNKYFDHSMSEEWFDRAHNNYFDILVTGGLIIFILYICFIFFVFRIIHKLYKEGKIDFTVWQIFTFGWLAYLIQNIFIFETLNTFIFIFIFISLLVYLYYKDDDKYFEKYNFRLSDFLRYCITIIIFVLFAINFNLYIIKPINASTKALDAYEAFVNGDLEEADSLLKISLNNADNYGTNDVLLEFYRVLEPQIKSRNFNNLAWATEIFEAEDLDLKSKIKLISLHISSMSENANIEIVDNDMEVLNNLVIKSPKRRALYYQLGQLYALKNDKENSIANFKYAVEIKKDKRSLWNLATAYLFLKDIDEFTSQINYILDEDYDLSIDDFKYLVKSFDKLKNNEILEKIYLKLLEKDRSASNLADLAIVELRLEKTDEAIIYAQEAIKLDEKEKERLSHLFDFK